jgi:U2-associated protein SR140
LVGLLDEFKTRQEKKDTGYDALDMYMDGAMGKGSFDDGDPTTTNIFISYLAPTMTEEQLFDLFAKYGPKNSVKVSSSLSKSHDITIIVAIAQVMWPRSEEERSRKRNCGFVSFIRIGTYTYSVPIRTEKCSTCQK